jgi:2',3'-cyclic-nucleotide 2'-phosphodiesterase (5'-nucleotidase family)
MSNRNLTIIQVNDTHGYLEPHPELVWRGDAATYPLMGGYARIASILKRARTGEGSVLALDNGDTFHGTYPAVASKGEAFVPLVNALRFDAMTAHWEFAWGPPHFRALAARLDYPMLAINCYDKQSGSRYFPSSIVVERGGLRVAIIGIAATIIDKSMPPHFSEGLMFTSGREELPAEIHRLRTDERAELVVVLSHLGFPQDVSLARSVVGIDVIVSGHTHNRLETPVVADGALIIQSGCHGSFVGRLDLEISGGRVIEWRHQLIPVDESVEIDVKMNDLVQDIMKPHRRILQEVVGHTEVGMHRDTNLFAPMDDLLLAAVAAAADTEIAFSNGWRYGAPIPPGPITMNDLWNMIPTNPPVSTVNLTGAEIREMMEENLERTFAADPFGQMGGYLKRFRGLTIYGKLENPPGQRIEHLFIRDDALTPDGTYRVAFVTEQSVPKKFGKSRRNLPIDAIEALRNYLQNSPGCITTGLGRFIAA